MVESDRPVSAQTGLGLLVYSPDGDYGPDGEGATVPTEITVLTKPGHTSLTQRGQYLQYAQDRTAFSVESCTSVRISVISN